MKIRNISPDALQIGRPGGRLEVAPDEVVDVSDDDGDAHVWRVEGIPGAYDGEPELAKDDPGFVEKYRRVPSDLWVEVPDLAATAEPGSEPAADMRAASTDPADEVTP